MQTLISIQEENFQNDFFKVTLKFSINKSSHKSFSVKLSNPYHPKTEKLLELYFEEYLTTPYDDIRIQAAPDKINQYGVQLFEQLFSSVVFEEWKTIQPENLTIEIKGQSPEFQSIYWETLRESEQEIPLVAKGVIFRRASYENHRNTQYIPSSSTINLLIVTARPKEESDVNFRTVQKPLINLIEDTKLPVRPHILRPGTYEAFVEHLQQVGDNYYHIIHFDLHGSLLNFKAYKSLYQVLKYNTFIQTHQPHLLKLIPFISQDSFETQEKAFIFFESAIKGVSIPVEANQLAQQIKKANIPIVILNACQSAKQEQTDKETSLGKVLLNEGIAMVLAMRYSISVSAVEIFMRTFYEQLYQNISIEKAIAKARMNLFQNKKRSANFNREIVLEDWCLPVLYQNEEVILPLRSFTEQEAVIFQKTTYISDTIQQNLPYGFFGRDLDILKIEKSLLTNNNILLLQSMGGAGKTTLLKYLGAWWLKTNFTEKVFYFGYDLKSYFVEEIIQIISKEIYTGEEYERFRLLSENNKEQEIIEIFLTHRFTLILDNFEAITGEKLAIQNTLPESERINLKTFLQQLKNGKSFVLIGSRSSEVWLKEETFDKNHYILSGLGQGAASNFAQAIIADLYLDIALLVRDFHFKRLLKLLAGSPLALKCILPNLKKKSAEQILIEMQQGLTGLNTGNSLDKTENMLACIEYAYWNMSEATQKFLLCFAPFISIINIEPEFIKDFVDEIQKTSTFKDINLDKLDVAVEEATNNGLMEKLDIGINLKIFKLLPLFSFFLKRELNKKVPSIKEKLENDYIIYFIRTAMDFNQLMVSNNEKEQIVGLTLMELEFENLLNALNLRLERKEGILQIFEPISYFLQQKRLHNQRLNLTTMVEQKIEQYDKAILKGDLIVDYFAFLDRKANIAIELKEYQKAKRIWNNILDLLKGNENFTSNFPILKGIIYQNLGETARRTQENSLAIEYAIKSLTIFQKHGTTNQQAQAYQNLGIAFLQLDSYETSIGWLKEAANLFEANENYEGLGASYQNLGAAYNYLGNYNQAEYFFYKALGLYKRFNDEHGKAEIFQSLGVIFKKQEKNELAIIHYKKALRILEQFKDSHNQAEIFQNLGNIYFVENNFELAKNYYQKALSIYRNYKNDFFHVNHIMKFLSEDFVKKTQDKDFVKSMFELVLIDYQNNPTQLEDLNRLYSKFINQ